MLPPFPAPLAARIVNALLAREPWAMARLKPHAGKTVRLIAGGLDVAMRVRPEGRIEPGNVEACGVTVRVDTRALSQLASPDPATRMSALHVEGDAALAQVAADLARDLRWDGEEELARVIGDLPARMFTRFATSALGMIKDSANRFAQNTSEYVIYETKLLANPQAVMHWQQASQALDERLQALEARLDHYERSRGTRA